MAINGIPGGAGAMGGNPLSGLGGAGGMGGGQGSLSGMGDLGLGDRSDGGAGAASNGLAPSQAASPAQAASFGDTIRALVVENPSASKAYSSDLAARFAAGENVDPHQMAIASAKAGVEVQMATRTISSAVSAVRTLFQMQI